MFETEQITGAGFKSTLRDFLRAPYRKFEFSTAMSTEHIARVLQANVEPPRKFGWPTSNKRGFFEGSVAGSRFKIHRVISVPNSFLPIVEGRLRREGFATSVTLTMRLLWPVVLVWIGGLGFLLWNSIAADSPLGGTLGARVVVLAVAAFMYLVASVSFAIEVRLAMERLLSLLGSAPAGPGLSF